MVKTDQKILNDFVTVATACRRHYAQNRAVLSVDSAAYQILHRRFEIRALQLCCDFVNDDVLPGNVRAYRAAQPSGKSRPPIWRRCLQGHVRTRHGTDPDRVLGCDPDTAISIRPSA